MQMAELSKNIRELKSILYGNGESEPVTEACVQLTQEFFKENTLRLLIIHLPKLNLEVYHFNTIFVCKLATLLKLLLLCPSPILFTKKRGKYLRMHLYFCLLQTRKDATQVVANLQRQQVSSKIVASEYLESNKDLLDILISG